MQTPYGYVSIISDVPVKPSHAIRRSLEPHKTTSDEDSAVYKDSVLLFHSFECYHKHTLCSSCQCFVIDIVHPHDVMCLVPHLN